MWLISAAQSSTASRSITTTSYSDWRAYSLEQGAGVRSARTLAAAAKTINSLKHRFIGIRTYLYVKLELAQFNINTMLYCNSWDETHGKLLFLSTRGEHENIPRGRVKHVEKKM